MKKFLSRHLFMLPSFSPLDFKNLSAKSFTKHFFTSRLIVLSLSLLFIGDIFAQNKGNDVTAPLHALKVDYPVPYGAPSAEEVKKVLDRVFTYLNEVTPPQFIQQKTGAIVSDLSTIDTNTVLKLLTFA